MQEPIPLELIQEMEETEYNFASTWVELYPNLDLIYDQIRPVPQRNFRCDFVNLRGSTIIEIHGGIWLPKGGHNTGEGILRDREKCLLCKGSGWEYFELADEQVFNEKFLGIIAQSIRDRIQRRIPTPWYK